jgi:hypothetical protein
MGSQTAAGSSLALSAMLPSSFDAAGYVALTYVEIGQVEKLGSFGASFAKVEFQGLKGAKQKFKGSADYGALQPSIALDPLDAGQILLQTASDDETQKLYSFRVTFQDGSARYFRGRVFGAPETADSADSMLMATPTVEICSKVVKVDAGATITPSPTLTQPSISPTSGAVGTTFTATDGTVTNGTITGRRWLLGTTAIGTGTTVTPNAAGSLTRENTAVGTNGETITSTSVARTVSAASAPSLSLSSAVAKAEGNSGTTLYSWTLTLNRDGSTAAYPFSWSTAGSGTNPANAADFGGAFPTGSGTFAAGETSKTISVLVAGDTAFEPDDTFTLTVVATGLNTVTSTGTISNDDAAAGVWNTGVNFIQVGNSFVAGFGATGGQTFPFQLRAMSPIAGSGTRAQSFGATGNTWAQLSSLNTVVDDAWIEGKYNILCVGETTNSVFSANLNAADTIASAKAYIAARKAARQWDKVVLFGTIPRQNTVTPANTPAYNAILDAVDADMKANPAAYGADLFVDVRAGNVYDFAGDYSDAKFATMTDYYGEAPGSMVHPKNIGYGLLATNVAAALQTIAVPAPKPEIRLAAPITLNEGNSGLTPFTHTIRRQTASDAIVVPVTFAAGTATAANFEGDALPPTVNVSMAAGVLETTFTYNVKGNTTSEGRKTYNTKIGIPSGYAAGMPISTINTIWDDDAGSGLPLGPNLVETGAIAYAAGPTGFGQARTGGYGVSPLGTGADVLPTGQTWTVEARFKISAIPTSAGQIIGLNQRVTIGVSKTDGRLTTVFRAPSGLVNINATTDNGGGTNPFVCDGQWHTVAMVSGPGGVYTFLDGVQIGQETILKAKTDDGSLGFQIGCSGNIASYTFTGAIQEVAAFAVERFHTSYTPRTTPYTGSEPGLVSLYPCDGNMNAKIKP